MINILRGDSFKFILCVWIKFICWGFYVFCLNLKSDFIMLGYLLIYLLMFLWMKYIELKGIILIY